ncbi:MAG: hypothetical protein JOY80_07205 [Candidatus Dormibacteraeota bacterium]|nr:hypothetical protein [Candidatus Dormibacteraeota bacterium]
METLIVELTSTDRPITGVVKAEGLHDRGFSGWLQLITALQAALDEREPERGGVMTGNEA